MMQTGGAPLIIINRMAEREQGHRVQRQNIAAAKLVADVIRTSLGPRAMLKMLMDPMGGIVLTNDGNAILREITVKHPAAKTMIEIARTQDEETGDGTTTVIILAGEFLAQAEQFLEQNIHPTGFRMALEDIIEWTEEKFCKSVDLTSESELTTVVKSCLGTKMLAKYMDLAVNIALSAVRTIDVTTNEYREIDIKRYCRIEKIPGGAIEDSNVVKGVVLNKDIVHPKMSRRIEKPRVLLLDCPLEYKKGESQTSLEIMKEQDFSRVLEQEEDAIKRQCDEIIRLKPNLVFTEKGISDLAQHYLVKAGITALRRLKKTDNNRLARVTGARIVNDTTDLRESDIGTQADLYEIKKVGDEYFTWITSEKTTAVTVVLRGPSKDIINEVERNIQDALHCVRNVLTNARVVPGAGALEMALSHALLEKAKSIPGIRAGPYKAVAHALEIVPRTLVQNCGGSSTIRQLTALRAKHAQEPGNWTWGINGQGAGELVDMAASGEGQSGGIWDPLSVRLQAIKTAIETAIMILRIDDIVSGTKKRDKDEAGAGAMAGAGGAGAE
uniref:T-complex protein 1 subunit gamma n=1 Tax=Globodera pallida TaxID=36090 RepID=A0A183C235_GLOPA